MRGVFTPGCPAARGATLRELLREPFSERKIDEDTAWATVTPFGLRPDMILPVYARVYIAFIDQAWPEHACHPVVVTVLDTLGKPASVEGDSFQERLTDHWGRYGLDPSRAREIMVAWKVHPHAHVDTVWSKVWVYHKMNDPQVEVAMMSLVPGDRRACKAMARRIRRMMRDVIGRGEAGMSASVLVLGDMSVAGDRVTCVSGPVGGDRTVLAVGGSASMRGADNTFVHVTGVEPGAVRSAQPLAYVRRDLSMVGDRSVSVRDSTGGAGERLQTAAAVGGNVMLSGSITTGVCRV